MASSVPGVDVPWQGYYSTEGAAKYDAYTTTKEICGYCGRTTTCHQLAPTLAIIHRCKSCEEE